jgi:nicotinate phosphoribosyltransferase
MPIIESLLDTDQYILTMCQGAFHQTTKAIVKYKFKCRGGNAVPKDKADAFINMLNDQIDNYCSLTFSNAELIFLPTIKCGPNVPPLFKRSFLDFLRFFKPNRDHIKAYIDDKGRLQVEIEGPMYLVIWFEVPVLAMVSELNSYFRLDCGYIGCPDVKVGRARLASKVLYLKSALDPDASFTFVDFGTRRRYAKWWHMEVVEYLMERVPQWFVGTSNMHLAMKYGITPVGTMAHAWFQLFQRQRYRLGVSQKAALSAWVEEYQGDLGIALSDIGGFEWFLKDFNLYYAKLFDGCRHDSGDPFWWCEKLIKHYEGFRIDPKTKLAVFSDGLDFGLALRLYEEFHQRIKTSFGIGTWLTNDMAVEALQIVIKMVMCNGGAVSKRSDSLGKKMCEDQVFDDYFGKVIAEETANGILH